MLDIELFARMFKLMDRKFELVHKRVHLGAVLVVNLCNIDPALVKQGSLVSLGPCITLAMACFSRQTTAIFAILHLFCHLLIQPLTPPLPLADLLLQSIIKPGNLLL